MLGARLLTCARTSLAICVALSVPVSGLSAGAPARAAASGEPRVPDAVMSGKGSGPAPVQRTGSAAGHAAVTDEGSNGQRPPSLRSMFPMFQPGALQQPVQQVTAAKAVDPKPVNGFNAATSREVPERRDKFAQSFRNADGTQTTVFSLNPANYRRPDGTWAPIGTGLVRDGTDWIADRVTSPVRLAGRAGSDRLASVALDGEREVSWTMSGARPVAGRFNGGTASYAGIDRDVDLQLEVLAGGLKETIVLRSKTTARSFVFPLKLKGLTPELAGREVVLRDTDGKQRAVIPAGSMEDAAKASSSGVTYRLLPGPALRVDVDDAWLDDPARVFPVRVDPTLLPTDEFNSNYAVTVRPGGAELGDQRLELGWRNGGGSAAYLSFGHVSSNLAYHRITGAELAVLSYDAPSCSARTMRVHGVQQQWQTTPRDQLRFPGPPVTAAVTSLGFANGYIPTGQTTSACAPRWQRINMWTAGRDLIQNWVNQKGNYGLALRAGNETDPLAWKRLIGTASANPPKLFITHTPYNAWYNVHPLADPANDSVMQDRAGKIPVTVKNTSAQNWTPATHYMSYRVFDAAGRRVGAGTELQTPLPGDIVRTAYRTFKVNVQALPGSAAGTPYRIEFTMVHRAPGGNVAFTDQLVPPGVANIEVFNIQPSFTKLWPVNGYQSTSLTPNLWAAATDVDAPDTTITYWFNVCELNTNPTVCFNSGSYGTSRSWTIPAGKLSWNKSYQWRPYAKDNDGVVTAGPALTLMTDVSQPPITSKIANAPLGSRDKEYDPQVGNYTTASLDASIPVAGPELNVLRTYNSLDPRKDRAFGAGWSSLQDMELIAETNGNAVVTYPDGQQVRFGKNPDGRYVAPPNRKATLIKETSGAWTLKAGAGTSYLFAADGKLQKVVGPNGLALVFTYRTDGSLLTSASSGRKLTFTWTADGRHIASVATDGVPLIWTYTYSGDVLTKVCNPNNECTAYGSAPGSHYRTAVLDSRPDAYYRLRDEDDPDRNNATNEIDLNFDLNRDTGVYTGGVLRAQASPLAGADDKSVSFTGSGYVLQPNGQLRRSRDGAVELWFKTTSTSRPLIGYQAGPLTTTATIAGMPILYVGSDGKLRGNFWNGKYTPITSAQAVNNGQWHHVVLSVSGTTQTMHLDGAYVGSLAGAVNNDPFAYNQIGAAHANSPTLWPGWGSTKVRYFDGQIDEVAVYSHPLTYGDIWSHWAHGRVAADQKTSVTSPDGRQKTRVLYDTGMDRVREYTDAHGGTWKVGTPESISTPKDLRRIVTVLDPADRPYVYEYDGLGGWLLRTGQPVATDLSPEDPVFNWTTGEGFAVRSYFHDAKGQLTKVTNEVGSSVEMTYDARGNVVTRKACRTGTTGCHTSYMTYHFSSTWPEGDPRLDKPFEVRDGRSASASDNTYRSTSSYTAAGDLSLHKLPDSGEISYTYTFGTEPSPDGGTMPKGLLRKQTGQLGGETLYTYFSTGQLAEVKTPSGLRTQYTYDAIGRKVTETQISDTYPSGVTTVYTYDKASRISSVTGPETTDAVTGEKHRQKVEFEYDADGHVVKTIASDVVAGGDPHVSRVAYDVRGRPDLTIDAEGNETNLDYDQFGNITRSQDPNGNVHEYRYTALNLLADVRLQDPSGTGASDEYKVLQSIGYDKASRKTRETDAMGRSRLYDYYTDDLLKTSVLEDFHNPDGTTRDFVLSSNEYDGAGNLTKETTDNGKTVTTYTRDVMGRITTQLRNPAGPSRQTTYTYDLAGNPLKETRTGDWSNWNRNTSYNPAITDHTYDTAGRRTDTSVQLYAQEPLTTSWTYDQRGLAVSETSPRGNMTGAIKADFTTTYTYDELGRQVKVIAPPVPAEQNGGAPVQARSTALTGYGAFGLATSTKDALGNVTRAAFDKVGRPVESTAPAYTPPGGTPIVPKTRLEYDATGQVTTSIDERGNATRFTYDRRGRRISVDAPASTNDERAVWSYTYTDNGTVASSTDPLGAIQQWTYDDLDRKVTNTVVDRRPAVANFTTVWGYDDQSNVTSVTNPSGATTTNTYDALGQLTRTTDPNGVPTHIGYNPFGHTVLVTDALGREDMYGYDDAGRLSSRKKVAADGDSQGVHSYYYDADSNLVQKRRPEGLWIDYAYDLLGRLTKQVDQIYGVPSITTSFGYDAAGNRTRYTDGRGNSTIYTFNVLGLPESVVEPSTVAHPAAVDRTWTASYDATGNPVSLASPGGVRRARTFDAAGRLTREQGSGAETATVSREVGYDLAGQVVSSSSLNGVNTHSYNDRGLLLRSDGPSGSASYGYDADGRPTQRIDAAGTADFTYDKGRLATVTDPVTRTRHTVGYNPSGQLASINYGMGRVRTVGYDAYARMNSDVLKNAAGAIVASQTYVYDPDDQIVSKKTTGVAGAGEHTYIYDELGRLTKWQVGAQVTEYGWDAASNRTLVRTAVGDQVARYDERNRLITDATADYSYSPRGALLSKTTGSATETFSFDAFDRLIGMLGRDYTYDALDRPVAVASPTGTTRLRYAGFSDEVVADDHQVFGRGPGDELLSIASGATKRLTLSDHHEDVIGGFDPADTSLSAGLPDGRTFGPWGETTHSSGLKYAIGYQGDWTDLGSGHVNQGARWYDPANGTFDSRDTVTYPASTPSNFPNLYAYAAGNPINNLDPTGNGVPCEDKPIPPRPPRPPVDVRAAATPAANCHEPPRPPTPPKPKPPKPKPQQPPGGSCDPCGTPPPSDRPNQPGRPGRPNPPKPPKPPACDAECQRKKDQERTDKAKKEQERDLLNNKGKLPPGIDDPQCPRGNPMCDGSPSRPSDLTSDYQTVGDAGNAAKLNQWAAAVKRGVVGNLSQSARGCLLCTGLTPTGDPFRDRGGAGWYGGGMSRPLPIDPQLVAQLGGLGLLGILWAASNDKPQFNGPDISLGDNNGVAAQPPDDDGPSGGSGREPEDTRGLSRDDLSPSQIKNLQRYEKKLPKGAGQVSIIRRPNGTVEFRADVPGRVPNSYARYSKIVDPSGRTVGYTKTTIGPDGRVIHIKDKMSP